MPNRRELIFPNELQEALADLITAEDDRKIVATLRSALDAEMSVRSPRMSRETGTTYDMIPDWRVRVLAAKIMAEMKHGRPTQAVDFKVSGSINAPMSKAEAARELLGEWESVKRIGDEHVRLLKQALPMAPEAGVAQAADAKVVDVDVG